MNSLKKDTYKRSDIEASLRKEFPSLTKSQISEAVDLILESIVEAIALDDKVEIRGFGTFSVRHRKARNGRNPRTGDNVVVPAKNVPMFKPGKSIRDRLNYKS